ncbi:unnamed protein product [Pedinophyceae sp. YPF-701]|nr:unnamed protein product [Pedinophyceae sp. YPF-701]
MSQLGGSGAAPMGGARVHAGAAGGQSFATHSAQDNRGFLVMLIIVMLLTMLPPALLMWILLLFLISMPCLRVALHRHMINEMQNRAAAQQAAINSGNLRLARQAETPAERHRRMQRLRRAFQQADIHIQPSDLEMIIALDQLQQSLDQHEQEQQDALDQEVAQEVVSALQTRKWTASDVKTARGSSDLEAGEGGASSDDSEGPCCAICLDDLEAGQDVSTLKCGHHYHQPCIERWVRCQGARASCPQCKAVLSERIAQRLREAGVQDSTTTGDASTSSGAGPSSAPGARPGHARRQRWTFGNRNGARIVSIAVGAPRDDQGAGGAEAEESRSRPRGAETARRTRWLPWPMRRPVARDAEREAPEARQEQSPLVERGAEGGSAEV